MPDWKKKKDKRLKKLASNAKFQEREYKQQLSTAIDQLQAISMQLVRAIMAKNMVRPVEATLKAIAMIDGLIGMVTERSKISLRPAEATIPPPIVVSPGVAVAVKRNVDNQAGSGQKVTQAGFNKAAWQ